jgi:hypothetical protein
MVGGILSITIGIAFAIGRKVDKVDFVRAVEKIDKTITTHIITEEKKFDRIFDKIDEIHKEIRAVNGKS